MTAPQLTNRWTAGSTVDAVVTPCPVRPGQPLCITVRGLPTDARAVWCRGGKLRHGFDTAYPLACHAPGAWQARLPVAAHATAGTIRLFLYVRRGAGAVTERHDITGGTVDTVTVSPETGPLIATPTMNRPTAVPASSVRP